MGTLTIIGLILTAAGGVFGTIGASQDSQKRQQQQNNNNK